MPKSSIDQFCTVIKMKQYEQKYHYLQKARTYVQKGFNTCNSVSFIFNTYVGGDLSFALYFSST